MNRLYISSNTITYPLSNDNNIHALSFLIYKKIFISSIGTIPSSKIASWTSICDYIETDYIKNTFSEIFIILIIYNAAFPLFSVTNCLLILL